MPVEARRVRNAIRVGFPYDRGVIDRVKQIPGYEWDKGKREWKFPLDTLTVDYLVRMFDDLTIDPSLSDWYDAAKKRADRIKLARSGELDQLLYEHSLKLYPYQKTMVAFMTEAKRCLNSDQMGLGKTIETIASIRELDLRGELENRRFLIVCPNSMRYTWMREIATWYPETLPVAVVNSGRELEADEGWFIINWEKLWRREAALLAKPFGAIVGDESHRMKNKDAKQSKAMHKLDSKVKFLLSGTPIKNHVPELWSQLHWLDRARFSSYWKFMDQYVMLQEDFWGHKQIVGTKNEDELREVLTTIQMGRTIDEAWHDRPTLVGPKLLRVTLGDRQRKAYTQMQEELVAEIERTDSDVGDIIKAPNWMTQFLRLKQIAGSLGIFSDEHKDSAKLDLLFEKMEEAEGEKIVVMSQFRTLTMELHERLKQAGEPHIVLTGQGVGSWDPSDGYKKFATRDDACVAFNTDPKWRLFIATTQTGGEGLTLVGARYFFFLDLLWTPADNDQAWARVYRRGQTRTTFVYAIVADDTIDFSGILPKLKTKRDIIEAVLGKRDESEVPLSTNDANEPDEA